MQPGLIAALLAAAAGHSIETDPNDSWQVRHMKLEHGADSFEPKAFFLQHDSDNTRTWTRDDVLFLYGLQNKNEIVGDGSGMGTKEQSKGVDEATKDKVWNKILELMDTDKNGIIDMDEWRNFVQDGGELPDFGLGPGHHGDYEYEYEVHHWQQYHAESDPDVKIVHPEDVEHERLYHQYEHNDNGWEDHQPIDASWVRTAKIPQKFRKAGA